jgi:acetylornithine deacetylase ArgE
MPGQVDSTTLLQRLVAIPSINPMGRAMHGDNIYEHRVTAFLDDFFRGLGVRYERQRIADHRENIVAHLEFPGAPRTLLFEAHQDTVPTDNMTIDPFGAKIADGKLSGRGACDIKGGMAAMLAAFARLARERPRNASNVIMACTVDEEFTFLGVQRLVQGLRADMAIVAEPTQLQIVKAHKGTTRWMLHAQGKSCHSSSPEKGINAIYRMGKLLGAIEQYANELRASRNDPLLGPPTLSVGRIEGGTSVNTVPDRCWIEIDRRILPGEEPQAAWRDFIDNLRKQPELNFEYEVAPPWLASPALGAEHSADVIARLGAAIAQIIGKFSVIAVPYGTDASTIALAGIPSVVFGPGDIAQAHTADEWVSVDEVAQASEILYRLACSP